MVDISPVVRNTWDNNVIVTRDGVLDQTWDGKTKNLVYDVGTLSWVAETQPTGGAGGGGDASAANQTTEIAKLTSIDGKLGSLGQKAMAASAPVVIASDQSGIPVTGTFFQGTQPVSGTVTANAGTNLNTSALNLESTQSAMSAKLPATLGQKAMAASLAVTLASDQASVPVAATLQPGAALVGKVGIDQTTPGTTNKVSIGTDGTVAVTSSTLPSGASTSANQATEIASLASIDGKLTSVAVGSSALPQGAATDATLQTGNSIESNTVVPLLQSMLTELKIITAFLGAGLNVTDDPEKFRNDTYYQ